MARGDLWTVLDNMNVDEQYVGGSVFTWKLYSESRLATSIRDKHFLPNELVTTP
jgi:hypothetical protein